MTEHRDDHEPPSVPPVLTDEQAARVRAALAPYVAGRTARESAKALGYARMYVGAVLDGTIRPSVHFAARVAHVLDVDLGDLLGLFGDGGAS